MGFVPLKGKTFTPWNGCFLLCIAIFLSHAIPAHSAEIAILKSQDLRPYNETIKAFIRQADTDVDQYDMEGDMEKGNRIAATIIASHPKLIVAIGTKASMAVSQATSTIPVVSLLVSRPEIYLQGRKNVVGISLNPDPRDQLKLLKKLYPKAQKIGVVYDGGNQSQALKDGKRLIREEYQLVEEVVSSESETPAAVRSLMGKVDVLWLVMDEKVVSEQSLPYITTVSMESRLPIIGFAKSIVKSGALFSTVTEFDDIWRQGADLATRILDGADPAKISFIYPHPSGYVLNLRSAKLMDMLIPASIIKNAKEVYE